MRYLYAIALTLFISYYMLPLDVAAGDNGAGIAKDGDDRGDDDAIGDNSFEVDAQTNLGFVIDEPSDFENTQIKVNAIKIEIRPKGNDCAVYARVSSYNTPSGANKNDIPLELEHSSNNSNKVIQVVRGPIQLTNTDKLLFIQSKHSKPLNFYYNLSLMPLGFNYPEGQYNFTIMYTMTRP